jgi:hypothetical protein
MPRKTSVFKSNGTTTYREKKLSGDIGREKMEEREVREVREVGEAREARKWCPPCY